MASRRRDLPDHAGEVRRALADPAQVAELLGLERSREERGKWVCPKHGGSSLSLRVGRDRTLQAKCFGCDFAGDVLALVAEVRGLDVRGDFRRVLAAGAEVAGLWGVVAELEGRDSTEPRPVPPPKPRAMPRPIEEERTYPPADELAAVWSSAGVVGDDDEARAMLEARGLDAELLDVTLARVVARGATLPTWARYQGRPWTATGHRLLLPVYDAAGVMRSVRAWRLVEGNGPKRLPPTGHKAGGVVLACELGVAMLAGTYAPKRVLVLEGEPDFLTWATRPIEAPTARLGVVSGAWSDELAARIPSGARVIVRTHHDTAGDKYAGAINATLRDRCTVLRSKVGE